MNIPNAALRFNPKPNQVRPCDLPIVEGTSPDNKDAADDDPSQQDRLRRQRYVWIEDEADGGLLSAVKITIGISDKSSTELVSGDLVKGQMVVTGMQTR